MHPSSWRPAVDWCLQQSGKDRRPEQSDIHPRRASSHGFYRPCPGCNSDRAEKLSFLAFHRPASLGLCAPFNLC